MIDLLMFVAQVYLSAAVFILIKWCWDTRKETHWNLVVILVRVILALGWLPLVIKAWRDDGDYPFQGA